MTRRNLSDVLRQEVTKDPAEAEVNEADPKAESTASAKSTRTQKAAPADQSDQLAELKVALTQGAEQEKALQTQIKALEASAKQQLKQIQSLEDQIEQVSQLKADLAEAREVILQLSESNTELTQTLEDMKPKQSKQPQRQPQKPLHPPKARALAVRPLPQHSMQIKPTDAVDQPKSIDVGWMD